MDPTIARAIYWEYVELVSHRRASGAERTERLADLERRHPALRDLRQGLIVAEDAINDMILE